MMDTTFQRLKQLRNLMVLLLNIQLQAVNT